MANNKIMEIIENDPVVKQIYENNGGCFKNVIVPRLMECNEDNELETTIMMLAMQTAIYDTLLDNIAQYGSKDLIKKCNTDIDNLFKLEE